MKCLSIGENCLIDMILFKYGLKVFSTPYSFARSNIFYAIQLEKNKYANLLNPSFCHKNPKSPFPNLLRNEHFDVPNDSAFNITSMSGFEFSHHDILNNQNDYDSYVRKIKRMIDLRASHEDLVFFYHHRYKQGSDLHYIIKLLEEFRKFYVNPFRNVSIVLLEQRLYENPLDRHFFSCKYNNVVLCLFYTKTLWSGSDPNDIFARNDEDLIFQMIFDLSYKFNLLDQSVIPNFLFNKHLAK